MRASPWSLAFLMMVLGTALVFFSGQTGHRPPLTTYVVAGPLVVAGALLLLKRPFTYFIALGAGLLTLAMSIASFALHRELVPTPIVTLVVGLMVSMRVLLAQSYERRAAHRESLRALDDQRDIDAV